MFSGIKQPSLNLSLEFLVGDLLVFGLLGDGLKVAVDVADPLVGVSLALLDNLPLVLGQSPLLFQTGLSGKSPLLVGSCGSLSHEFSVGVKTIKSLGVVEGVVLLDGVQHSVSLGLSDGGLHLVGVDDSGNVGVAHLAVGKVVSLLLNTSLLAGSEDVVQFIEGTLSPNDKSADMSSRSKLKKIESGHVGDFHSGHVSQSLKQRNVGTTVDNERSSSASETSASKFTLSSTNLNSVDNLLDISPGSDVLEESNSLLGSFDLLNSVAHNERELRGSINSVSSCLDQRQYGGCGEGSSDGVPLLVEVVSSVPSSPDSNGSEHSSLAAHVTEGTLSVAAGSGSTDSGNTGNGTTSTPRLSGVFHAGLEVDCVTLSTILGDVGVDEVDDVGSDTSAEDSGQDHIGA